MDNNECSWRKNFVFGNEYKEKVAKEVVHLTETSEIRINPYDNSDFVYRGKIKCRPQA